MKLFDHIDSELAYTSKSTIYLEDSAQRIWEISKNDIIKIRNLASISSLKSVDSPMSICSDNPRLSAEGKNNTTIHDMKKLSADSDEDKVTNFYLLY